MLRIPARPSKEDQMGVSVEALKSEIKGYNYEVITGGDDAVAQRAIEKAELWAKAKIIQAKGEWDDENEIIKLIVIKRALYELYSYAENEAVAQDKKEDAMELLKAYYGNAIDASGYTSGSPDAQKPLAIGAVKKCSHIR